MKAQYCVDYLSHQWNTDDLITTYKETRKQRQKYVVNSVTSTTSLLIKNEKKLKKSEEYKLKRFQNALWRNMARNCTDHLGKSNKLINPATVSWQKESDITWLYGPLYMVKMDHHTHDNRKQQLALPDGLKPVLKKKTNFTQPLPTCPDLCYNIPPPYIHEYSNTNTTDFDDYYNHCYQSSTANSSGLTSNRSSFSSIGVHFNPEIIEIEYRPEYPVRNNTTASPHLCESDEEDYSSGDLIYHEEDDDDDDAIWSLLVQASESLKSSTYTQISFLFSKCLFFYNQQQQAAKLQKKHHNQLVILFIAMLKSVFSLTTTWFLYFWLNKPTTAGQSVKQSKKARLTL